MQVARSCNCSLLRVHASLTWCYLPQRSMVLPHSCKCSLLWLPEPQRIAQTSINEQMAQVYTFKGLPPDAVIAKNGFCPAIFSQSVFFSVGVRSLRKNRRIPGQTLRN